MQEITQCVDGLILSLSEDVSLSARIRAAAGEVYSLYHTSLRADILNVFLPIVHRLRNRIRNGEVAYFAGDSFLPIVSEAVRQRCYEVVSEGRMPASAVEKVAPRMDPILEAIQTKARAYLQGDISEFEAILERMVGLLDKMEAQQAGSPGQ